MKTIILEINTSFETDKEKNELLAQIVNLILRMDNVIGVWPTKEKK